MPRRLIDLTLNIVPAISWIQFPRKILYGAEEPPTIIETVMDKRDEDGGFVQKFQMTTQSFTHIDAPRHFLKNGLAVDQIPLGKLMGEAVVIDMGHKRSGEEISIEDLETTGIRVQRGDMVIIRTGLTDRSWGSKEFWTDMIYLSEDACDWVVNKKPNALVVDFHVDVPAFAACKVCGALNLIEDQQTRKRSPNHHKFLEREIILIENCTNLFAIQKPRVILICMPLKIQGADGAPARVVAIEEY